MNKKLYSVFIAVFFVLTVQTSFSQDVMSKLKSRYPIVQYHKEQGGWYFLSYQKNQQTLYGIADKDGNVVALDAYKYVLHPGFAELQMLDAVKKNKHDEWKREMEKYNKDYAVYQSKKKKYEAELEQYRSKVAVAEQEARRRHRVAQDIENKKAQAEAARLQYQMQASGANSTMMAIGAAISAVGAVVKPLAVRYEPFLQQVLAERDLLTAPPEPYNPKPDKPVEPSEGYYWSNVTYRPCPYDEVDWNAIKTDGGIALVSCKGKYGLINSDFKVLAPTKYASITRFLSGWLASSDGKVGYIDKAGSLALSCDYDKIDAEDQYFKCLQNGLWGIFSRSGKEIYPCQFEDLSVMSLVGQKLLKNKSRGLWGVLDFDSGQELVTNTYGRVSVLDWNLGLMAVERNGKRGVFSHKGRMLIPCEYSETEMMQVGNLEYIKVKALGTIGLFGIDGACLVPVGKYQDLSQAVFGGRPCWLVKRNDLWGVVDYYGEQIVDCRYNSLSFDDDLQALLAENSEGHGVIVDFAGKEYARWNYDDLSHTEGDPYLISYDGTRHKYVASDFNGTVIARFHRSMPHEKESSFVARRALQLAKKMERKGLTYNMEEVKDSLTKITKSAFSLYAAALDQKSEQRRTFSWYAQNYVERLVNEWQRKGEFEKTADYQKRVNEDTRRLKILSLTKEAQEEYLSSRLKRLPKDNLSIVGDYDSDNETYRIQSTNAKGEILVHVPVVDAQEFRSSFADLKKEAEWMIMNDNIGLSGYKFTMPSGKTYAYHDNDNLRWDVPDLEYSFEAISIDKASMNMGHTSGVQSISVRSLMAQKSDVDLNIPSTPRVKENKFAFIIANEAYENEPRVDYAFNDGTVFRDYCINTLGIPSKHVTFASNATLNQMKRIVNQIRETATAFDGESEIILYYAGHGMPDDSSREAYLLPSDGFHQDKSSGMKLHDLYEELSGLKCKSVVLLMDACFSGAKRGGGSLNSGARAVVIRPRQEAPSGNLIVISAASADQTANPYPNQAHGMFTYFLLKKLQENGDETSLGDLFSYIKSKTQKQSIVETKSAQTPTIQVAPSLASSWKSIKI